MFSFHHRRRERKRAHIHDALAVSYLCFRQWPSMPRLTPGFHGGVERVAIPMVVGPGLLRPTNGMTRHQRSLNEHRANVCSRDRT